MSPPSLKFILVFVVIDEIEIIVGIISILLLGRTAEKSHKALSQGNQPRFGRTRKLFKVWPLCEKSGIKSLSFVW
jgi:hypothetical protein